MNGTAKQGELRLEGLAKSFGKISALRHVDLEVEALIRDRLDFLSAAEREQILGGTAEGFFFGR